MSDVLTPTDDFLTSPEFGDHFTEWQRLRLGSLAAEDSLSMQLAKIYGEDRTLSPDAISERVSWYLEISQEDFEEACSDDRALLLSQLRQSALVDEVAAKEKLLKLGEDRGLGQFALYGLYLHTRHSGVVTAPVLGKKVAEAVQDFTVLDDVVRQNSGNVMTIVDLGLQSGRLGEGGITISDNRIVLFPKAEGTLNYSASLQTGIDEIFSETRSLGVHISSVHNIMGSRDAKIIDDWSALLALKDWSIFNSGAQFILGEVVEGPAIISGETDQDYHRRVFEQIRTIGQAAASNAAL